MRPYTRNDAAICFCVAILCLTPTMARGDIIKVPVHEPTIQAGIDAAVAGDEIVVLPGTYIGGYFLALLWFGTIGY